MIVLSKQYPYQKSQLKISDDNSGLKLNENTLNLPSFNQIDTFEPSESVSAYLKGNTLIKPNDTDDFLINTDMNILNADIMHVKKMDTI